MPLLRLPEDLHVLLVAILLLGVFLHLGTRSWGQSTLGHQSLVQLLLLHRECLDLWHESCLGQLAPLGIDALLQYRQPFRGLFQQGGLLSHSSLRGHGLALLDKCSSCTMWAAAPAAVGVLVLVAARTPGME